MLTEPHRGEARPHESIASRRIFRPGADHHCSGREHAYRASQERTDESQGRTVSPADSLRNDRSVKKSSGHRSSWRTFRHGPKGHEHPRHTLRLALEGLPHPARTLDCPPMTDTSAVTEEL